MSEENCKHERGWIRDEAGEEVCPKCRQPKPPPIVVKPEPATWALKIRGFE